MLSKVLLLLVIVCAAMWLFNARRRGRPGAPPKAPRQPPDAAKMIACVHCGVHLPLPEALMDPAGRPFCSEAHRLAGPR